MPTIVVVDDASVKQESSGVDPYPGPLIILTLRYNLGHQRAIAIGLSWVQTHLKDMSVLVMDGDGEDDPKDTLHLVKYGLKNPEHIIFASRNKREESLLFLFGYWCYKGLFKICTGHYISFGNFCYIPAHINARVVHLPDLWSHFAAAILRRITFPLIQVNRNKRIAGESHMSFTNLILHGLSAISVFREIEWLHE